MMILGICCAFCTKIDGPLCPVKSANNWSRWEAFCHAYTPNKFIKEAIAFGDLRKIK
jgi:hypothetical protein